jgi:hypothetical protein
MAAAGLLLLATGCSAQNRPLAEASESTIGYETVDAAMTGLRSKPGVVFTTENGWTIATDESALTIWSFAPEGYPAYPAVVMRQAVARGQQSTIVMKVLCEASKQQCDDLVRTFAAMNGLPVQQ